MPTITICHNQEASRYNFARLVLNQLSYGCLVEPEPGQSRMASEFEYEDWFEVVGSISIFRLSLI